jgi:hypothetical protein
MNIRVATATLRHCDSTSPFIYLTFQLFLHVNESSKCVLLQWTRPFQFLCFQNQILSCLWSGEYVSSSIYSFCFAAHCVTTNSVPNLSHNYIFRRYCFLNLIVGTHKGFKHILAIIKALFMVGKGAVYLKRGRPDA